MYIAGEPGHLSRGPVTAGGAGGMEPSAIHTTTLDMHGTSQLTPTTLSVGWGQRVMGGGGVLAVSGPRLHASHPPPPLPHLLPTGGEAIQ